ncbi:MAG TPA: peptidoglycan bridge formation glycyltransferase FemA/FemB family protein [Nocardioidaceae bacterium]|nr:peptidoglycan bridge formation glycyltransferase FemA/FemB family protein [Nocardioidaceae bacterium]
MTESLLTVRTLSTEEHRDFLRAHLDAGGSASFLQTPAWGQVKSEWRRESIGWFRDARSARSSTQGLRDARSARSSTQGLRDARSARSSTQGLRDARPAGAALVLYRKLPGVRRYLAYLPEGPVVNWTGDDLAAWLSPMASHLRAAGAFGVRMGPPVVVRSWDAAAVKAGVADDALRRLGDVPPTERDPVGARVVSQLHELGWRRQGSEEGFAAGQPAYNFWLPLRDTTGASLSEDDVLAGMNQQWRRNIKKSVKAGVEVCHDGTEQDLAAFHQLYVTTAARDGFTPRPRSYFQAMWQSLSAEDPDRIRLYLARHEGELVAATIGIRMGRHAWYSYGASSTDKRDVRGSNAVQWAMIRDALAAGCDIYDLRGITDTLDPDDPHAGLIRFKVGTGGRAVEYAGEWDLPLNRLVYKAFSAYMSRRGG